MKYLINVQYVNHSQADKGIQETQYKREGNNLFDILTKEATLIETIDDQVEITVLSYNAVLDRS